MRELNVKLLSMLGWVALFLLGAKGVFYIESFSEFWAGFATVWVGIVLVVSILSLEIYFEK